MRTTEMLAPIEFVDFDGSINQAQFWSLAARGAWDSSAYWLRTDTEFVYVVRKRGTFIRRGSWPVFDRDDERAKR